MISDLDWSLGSRYFLNVANERTCFASCASAFKSTGLFTCLECASDLIVTYVGNYRQLKNKGYSLSIFLDRIQFLQTSTGRKSEIYSIGWPPQAPKKHSTAVQRGGRNSLEERETRR